MATSFNIIKEQEADWFVHYIASNWQQAPLGAIDQQLCRFAEKLTLSPRDMQQQDILVLQRLHLSDRAIHDATQVISYFNYINRIADGLGVEPENFIRAWEKSPYP